VKPRLLKRIKSWGEAGAISASDIDVNEMMESVRDDLEKLFNTRRGTVLIDENYGLPDFTHLMNGYAAPDADEIERNLSYQVRQYETRLSAVSLSYQEPGSRSIGLRFALSAMFHHKNQELNLVAQVQFNDNGSVSVSL
jgi:type VI secretion system protein